MQGRAILTSTMIATLPMYDWPEIRHATNAWWQGLARHAGLATPLDRSTDYVQAWGQPDLVFSQTCGYPFTHEFKGKLNYIATPHYAADGCDGARYCSLVFAREHVPVEAFRGGKAAINGWDSMSGMLALKAVVAPYATSRRFFAETLVSGSHRQSLAMVQSGKADVCAVDSVCVGLARKHVPALLDGLVEIARSPQVPGLPYVTKSGDVELWRTALAAAVADPGLAEARAALLLQDVSVLPAQAYDAILTLENKVKEAGAAAALGEP